MGALILRPIPLGVIAHKTIFYVSSSSVGTSFFLDSCGFSKLMQVGLAKSCPFLSSTGRQLTHFKQTVRMFV